MTFQNLISRRHFASAFALAGSALVLPQLQAQSKPEKPRVVIAVDSKHAFSYLPLTIADQLGYFKAEGLDVQISDFGDTVGVSLAMLSGTADVCSGAFDRTLLMQAKNQTFKAFVLQARAPQLAFGVSTRSVPTYAAIADLKGKKLGVPALDSTASVMVHLLLRRSGVSPQDVSFVAVGSSVSAVSAMRSGQIDALCNTDPVMTLLEQKGDVKIISETRTLRGTTELFGGAMPSSCLYAPSDFVQKNPNTCQALTHAIVHSLKWLQTAGPGDIIKTVPDSYLLGDRALYLASFNKIRESISIDGLMPEDGPATALNALLRFDPALRLVRIDLSKTYTNEFVKRAKVRFRT